MGKKKKASSKKSFGKKILIAFIGVVFFSGLLVGWSFYHKVFSPNVVFKNKNSGYIYIPTGSKFIDVLRMLQSEGVLKESESFSWLAEVMKYSNNVKPGRYLIRSNMNNRDLIKLLRSGQQTPLRLTFSNLRTIEQLAGIVGSKIEADSLTILTLMRDQGIQEMNGFTSDNSLSAMIPDTYEFYWNTSAEQFYERILKEYKKYWNQSRIKKAEEIGFTKAQVSILASIVEQETRRNDEKPTIAGVYINRYKKGMKLEADPTLVYSLGDFNIRRVLNEHKLIDSPYNTYMYVGLPPGPICMPSKASIDAVLNYKKHNYLFFCAREDFSGYHSFASTYNVHLQNARKFQRELNKRGIRS